MMHDISGQSTEGLFYVHTTIPLSTPPVPSTVRQDSVLGRPLAQQGLQILFHNPFQTSRLSVLSGDYNLCS